MRALVGPAVMCVAIGACAPEPTPGAPEGDATVDLDAGGLDLGVLDLGVLDAGPPRDLGAERGGLDAGFDAGPRADRGAAQDVPPRQDVPSVPDAGAGADVWVSAGLASDIEVSGVALFQAVRVPLAVEGAAVAVERRNAPVLTGRAALVRVYVRPRPGFVPRRVAAELGWGAPGEAPWVQQDVRAIAGPSSDGAPAGVFAFRVPAERMVRGATVSVRLLAAQNGGAPGVPEAQLPRDGGSLAVGLVAAPLALRMTLVPVRWTGDGSNRLPDTSEAQLARYRALLTAMYPLATVELTVHAPVDYGATTLTGNVNFSGLNGALSALRSREAPPGDVYYYGLVAPRASRAEYCARGCVTGQSYVVNGVNDSNLRVGSGVGFSGDASAGTLAHELGHLHGRTHAPCGTTGTDRAYPYPNGRLGDWGWDPRTNTFFNPAMATDFMGYCNTQWVSDHTWRGLYARASALRPGPSLLSAAAPWVEAELVGEDEDGALRWVARDRWRTLPEGDGVDTATWRDARGEVIAQVEARVAREGEGGRVWWVPSRPGAALDLAGRRVRLGP